MARFSDKVILVTGAARGIGLETARQFAAEGGTVLATDHDPRELEQVAETSAAAGLNIQFIQHDVRKPEEWDNVFSSLAQKDLHLDVLVNNAGTGILASIEDTSLEQLRNIFTTNVEGVFHGLKYGIRAMKEKGGAIINLASIEANVAEPLLAAYSASKGAVSMMTKAAAIDCARKGYSIRINSIHPGFTETKLVSDALLTLGDAATEFANNLIRSIPMGRLAKPIEIAQPILFLASEDSSYMTGSELVVDGGFIAA